MNAAAPRPSETARADRVELILRSPAATEALACWLAPRLAAGDWLLLEGPLGAGKTALARALVGARLAAAGAPAEEVPSPSFTLVQTYAAGGLEIRHADLYRLGGPADVAELGLDEGAEAALTLVEWPDRLGPLAPARALRLTLAPDPACDARRRADVEARDPRHAPLLAALAAAAAAEGWAG